MHIAVLGPTGFGGSHACLELLDRGHKVTGISRSPAQLGSHSNYHPYPLDIGTASIKSLVSAFSTADVVLNAYNPPFSPQQYKDFVETTRRIILAAKASHQQAGGKLKYFVTIGGTGSLSLKDAQDPYLTAADSRLFWLAYRRALGDSEAATYHMEERIGFGSPPAQAMRSYREARVALRSGTATEEQQQMLEETEKGILQGPQPSPSDLPIAARAGFMFLDSDTTFPWTFVSPPGRYQPGLRTGKYEVWVDEVPLAPESAERPLEGVESPYEGRLLGITPADLAVSMADEIEERKKVHKHWSAVADLGRDEKMGSYARLS
ncbi:hypothetical protein MBLNU457_g0548t1 [Dothideomycetes sp. NU457]